MGGVVSDVVSGVGNLGQSVISGVDKALTGLDDAIPQEAKIAAAIYAASQGLPVGAEGSALANLGATDASLGAAGAVNAGSAIAAPVTSGSVLATQLPAFGTTGTAVTPAIAGTDFLSGMSQVAGVEGAGVAGTGLGSGITASTASPNLLTQAMNWATASPSNALTAAGLGLTAAKALTGNTPTSSTTTTSIDPEVKAAYLQNLAEARATAAGLAPRQFAPFPEYNLGMVQKYMNPYESQVIQGTLGDIERARQMQIAQEGAQATGARAFGGSRQAVTRSLVDEAALRNATNAIAQLRQQGFTQAQNLGLSQEALRQQYEQQRLDAARNLGLERLNVAQGALSLQPANIGGSQTTPLYRNPTVSGLGGALSGATLGRLIGGTANPEYAGYGAGLGGILGLLG